jgi:hypothetical protein
MVPGLGNPQAWDRYAYALNNPTRFIDPSGHKPCEDWDANGNCKPTEPDVPTQSTNQTPIRRKLNQYVVCGNPGLSPEGKAVCLDYVRLYNVDGWWHNNGNMTVEQFLGLMAIWERSGIAGAEHALKEAIKNQLWMDTSEHGGHPAFCQGTTCEDYEIFNFMGATMDPGAWEGEGYITKRVDLLIENVKTPGMTGPNIIKKLGEDHGNIMQKATEWGAYFTEYDPSRVAYDNTKEYYWGNRRLSDCNKIKYVSNADDPYAFYVLTLCQPFVER